MRLDEVRLASRSRMIDVCVAVGLLLTCAADRTAFSIDGPPTGARPYKICLVTYTCVGVAAKGACVAGLGMCTPDLWAAWACGGVTNGGCSYSASVECIDVFAPLWCHIGPSNLEHILSDCRGSCLFLAPGLCACTATVAGNWESVFHPPCFQGVLPPEW